MKQSVKKAPRMDLICCRNLLIYLEPALQKKALLALHYALKPEGFLFLGASESLGQVTNLRPTKRVSRPTRNSKA